MGNLATFLQRQFKVYCPPDWQAETEAQVMTAELRRLLGYAPQVDVLFTHQNGQRLWIEFEISRADPVANHAKFATAHLFQPQASGDVFLSMMSPHVASGKRNLAANTIWAMRYLGMNAYQTPLLPHFDSANIQRLNHMRLDELPEQNLEVKQEIQRALTISETLAMVDANAIHFVANNMEVRLNLHQWNQEITTREGQQQWGKRTITYFVYDPRSHLFAPSKFCAYVAIPDQWQLPITGATMTLARYANIDHDLSIFDGERARKHLTRNLAMTLLPPETTSRVNRDFERWVQQHRSVINVHPSGPRFIQPPNWF